MNPRKKHPEKNPSEKAPEINPLRKKKPEKDPLGKMNSGALILDMRLCNTRVNGHESRKRLF